MWSVVLCGMLSEIFCGMLYEVLCEVLCGMLCERKAIVAFLFTCLYSAHCSVPVYFCSMISVQYISDAATLFQRSTTHD